MKKLARIFNFKYESLFPIQIHINMQIARITKRCKGQHRESVYFSNPCTLVPTDFQLRKKMKFKFHFRFSFFFVQ